MKGKFILSLDEQGRLILESDEVIIKVPRHKLEKLSKIYNEVYPFINLSFEWIYETLGIEYTDYELLLKDEFLELFIAKLKVEDDIEVISKNTENVKEVTK